MGVKILVCALLALLALVESHTVQQCTTSDDNVIKCTSFSHNEIQAAYDKNNTAVGLDLSGTHIATLEANDFQRLPDIKRVYLDNAKVDDVMLDAFKHLRQLELLSLRNVQSDWSRMVDSLVRHPVGEVDISDNFVVCSCDHWHAYVRITASGTLVRNSTQHHCSMREIAMCLDTAQSPLMIPNAKRYQQEPPVQQEPTKAATQLAAPGGSRKKRAVDEGEFPGSGTLEAAALSELCAHLSNGTPGHLLRSVEMQAEVTLQQTHTVTMHRIHHVISPHLIIVFAMLLGVIVAFLWPSTSSRGKHSKDVSRRVIRA